MLSQEIKLSSLSDFIESLIKCVKKASTVETSNSKSDFKEVQRWDRRVMTGAVITEYCNMSLHGLTEHKKMERFNCPGSL